MKTIKTKRDNKRYTPPPAKPAGELQPLNETLAMIWSARKKLPKK